jgi:hypothetical protein
MSKSKEMMDSLEGKVDQFAEPADDLPEKCTVTWEGRSFTFYVKAISYLKEVEWQRRLAAVCGGQNPKSFENYQKLRAICIVRTCVDNIPEWLSWLILNDDDAAIAIASKFEEKTYSFREKHGAARDPETGAPRFSIT